MSVHVIVIYEPVERSSAKEFENVRGQTVMFFTFDQNVFKKANTNKQQTTQHIFKNSVARNEPTTPTDKRGTQRKG